MAEQELKQLRQKFQSQQKQFQSYRDECRDLESFLQQQSSKKQTEIRKLKEQSINKQKLFKSIKAQNNQLTSQLSTLKVEIARLKEDNAGSKESNNKKEGTDQIQNEMKMYKEKCQQFIGIESQLKQKVKQLEDEVLKMKKKERVYYDQIKMKEDQLEGLTTKNEELVKEINLKNKNLKNMEEKIQQNVSTLPSPRKERREVDISSFKMVDKRKDYLMEIQKFEQKILQLQDKLQRYERIIKDLRQKNPNEAPESPKKQKKKQEQPSNLKNYTACIIQTKPYYSSPILQIQEQSNTIKLFKSSRNGCFERSLGASKHKMDTISYDNKTIVQDIADKIMNFDIDTNHLILIYGVKKSNKKTIMSAIMIKMFNFLKNKIQNEDNIQLQSIFIQKKSQDQIVREDAKTIDQVLDILEKVTICHQQDENKKIDNKGINKKLEKSRITYFSLRVNEFFLEIATSSFTGIAFREKQILNTFLNNILYSRLADILPNSYSQKYFILTLNPIVDLYEQCKNTLSITNYKTNLNSPSKDNYRQLDFTGKELLNEMAKKKLQLYQKQIEQNLIKIRKIQDESFYFKSKFDQLENRLKTLLSTHHGQNSYLKKSPILLSYEKLLKFVHAVQSKSLNSGDTANLTLRLNDLDFGSEIDEYESHEVL